MCNFFSQTSRLVAIFPLAFLLISCGASDAPGLVSDAAIIAEGKSSVLEGDSGVSPLTLSFVAPVSGLIKYTTFDITAVARSDYLPVSGEFTAVLGERYAIQVDVLGDTRIEGTERFGVRLLDEQDQIVGEIIGEIINDDFPEFFVSSPVVAERNTGQTPLVFTVSLSAEPIDDFVLQVQTRAPDGCVTGYANATQSAECAQDYIPLTTTLTFREGESLSQTITVQVLADTQVEPDEILELDVTFQDVTVTGKGIIRNDDDATQVFSEISMNPARFTETETNGCVRFEYRLRDAGAYNLNYRLVSLTKEDWESRPEDLKLADDSDFRSLQGQVVFSDEQSSLTVCGISIIDDKLVETNEVFAIQLFNTEGAQFYTGYIFITDNDFPDFKLGVKEQTPPSDNGRQVILQEPNSDQKNYSLLFQSDFPVTDSIRYMAYEIDNEVSFGENPDVVEILPGTLNFSEDGSGGYSASIEITVLSDNLTERDELFKIGLTNANGQPLFDSNGNQQIYDVIIRDSQSDALKLLYSCEDPVSEGTEGNEQSCIITWANNIAENALPITLTHELIPCEVGDICASNDDFDDGFLNGVVIGKTQATGKEVRWTFGVQQDGLVEAVETATVKASARYAKDNALVNIIKSVDAPDFKIQDADALTLSTSCVKTPPEEGAGAASGSPFTEGDTVECTITTNSVAGNVPDFSVNVVLANECSTSGSGEPAPICADLNDFVSIPDSVTFGKAINGERTASWSAVIKKDSLVEVSEDAVFQLTFPDFKVGRIAQPDSGEYVIASYGFTIKDSDSLTLSYECKVDGTESTIFDFNEDDRVSCDISWNETIAPNALPITLTHKSLPCGEGVICASDADFDGDFLKGVEIIVDQPAVKKANWTFGVLNDELVEAPETANIAVSAKNKDSGRAINIATSDPVLTFTIQDGNALTLSTSCVKNSPEEGAGAASGSPFTEGDTVECTITTNDVAGNVPGFSVSVVLVNECSIAGSGEPAPICADLNDFVSIPDSVTFGKAINGERTASWSAVIKKDSLVEVSEDAVFQLTFPDFKVGRIAQPDSGEYLIASYGFTIKDSDSLTLSYECKVDGTESTIFDFNEDDRVSCDISWEETIAPNALPITLTHTLLCEGGGDSCLSDADFDGDFLKGVEIIVDQPAGKIVNWTFGVLKDGIVERTEKASIEVKSDKSIDVSIVGEFEFSVFDSSSIVLKYDCHDKQYEEGEKVTCEISGAVPDGYVAPDSGLDITIIHGVVTPESSISDVHYASNDDLANDFESKVELSFKSDSKTWVGRWTFTVFSDAVVEGIERAVISASAVVNGSDDPVVLLFSSGDEAEVDAPFFYIADKNSIKLSYSCGEDEGEVRENDTVTCSVSAIPSVVGDSVSSFSDNLETISIVHSLSADCGTSAVCADASDFNTPFTSVVVLTRQEGQPEIFTGEWGFTVNLDEVVEVTELAKIHARSFKFNDVTLNTIMIEPSDSDSVHEFEIKDATEVQYTYECSSGNFMEGSSVSCTATIKNLADNVPVSAITLKVNLSGCNEEGDEGSSDVACAAAADFDSIPESVTFVISDNGIRTASWSAKIKQDDLVELTETARFTLSVEGAVDLSSVTGKTIEFTIIDGDKLTVELVVCPGMPGSTDPVSEFNEGATVTCEIQTNEVAANVPAITLDVKLSGCNGVIEDGSSVVVCADSEDFQYLTDDQTPTDGFPASLVLSAVTDGTDGQRKATWSAILRADNLIEKQETANFVMTVTPPVVISDDSRSEIKLNFGFKIIDGDRLVISYPPGVVDEGGAVTFTASPDIAESVGLITVSLSLAGCANTGEIACADWADFNLGESDLNSDSSLTISFLNGRLNYELKPKVDEIVEHTETATFKVSVSNDFSHYFKQSIVQEQDVGISSFSDEDNATENKEIPMTVDNEGGLSGSFAFDITNKDEFEFSLSRLALEGEEYQLTAVGVYQFHSKAVTYTFDFRPAVMVSNSDYSCFVGSADIHCLIEDYNKLSSDNFLGNEVPGSKSFISENGQDMEGSDFSIPVRLTNSSPLQTLASWFTVTVAVDGNAPGINSSLPIKQPMLALNAETQSISVPSGSADSGAIYPAINHVYLNSSGALMVSEEYNCLIDNLTGLFWMRGSNSCNFKESDPKIDNAQGVRRPTISELLSLYSDPVNPIFEVLTGEIQSSSKCSAGTSVYWFNLATGAVTCSAPAEPVVVPAETPELFVIPFKEGSLQ